MSRPASFSQDWMCCCFISLVYLQTTGAELVWFMRRTWLEPRLKMLVIVLQIIIYRSCGAVIGDVVQWNNHIKVEFNKEVESN